jgi:hypothetical protein
MMKRMSLDDLRSLLADLPPVSVAFTTVDGVELMQFPVYEDDAVEWWQ